MTTRIEQVQLTSGAQMPDVDLFQTHVRDVWAGGWRGQGVRVAVVDSGVGQLARARGKVLSGVNLVPGGDPADVEDRLGHGDLVAALILTIAPEAEIVPIRIFGDVGSCEDPVAGRALQLAADGGDITNASIGGDGTHPEVDRGIRDHEVAGKSLIAAAGNSGDGKAETLEREWPAADPYAIAIGALDRGAIADTAWEWVPTRPAKYSVSNPYIDGVAIGRVPGAWTEGTSFAAPIVTGLAACFISWARATGRPHDDSAIYAWLLANTRQLPGLPAKNDQTGYGLVTLRPHMPDRRLEVDVDTLEAYMDGKPFDLAAAGIENRAPGGLFGWIRPVLTALGGRVGYDDARRRAWYKL